MFKTLKGKEINYDNLDYNSIDLGDICNALTNINRFGGHSIRPYSVAEHTILCLKIAKKLGYSEREQLLTLIHDFTEAYVVDLPTPLKKLLPEFQRYESIVEFAIYKKFDIEPPTEEEHKKVKAVDLTALLIEMRDLTLQHDYQEFLNEHVAESVIDNFKLAKQKYSPSVSYGRTIMKNFKQLKGSI